MLAQRAENQARSCVTIFSPSLNLQKRSLVVSDFVKALTNTFMNFLLAYQNTRESKFVLVANKVI